MCILNGSGFGRAILSAQYPVSRDVVYIADPTPGVIRRTADPRKGSTDFFLRVAGTIFD